MVNGEVVGGVQLGDQRAVVAGDQHGALAGRVLGGLLVPGVNGKLSVRSKWFIQLCGSSLVNSGKVTRQNITNNYFIYAW